MAVLKVVVYAVFAAVLGFLSTLVLPDPIIQAELRQLADRQVKLQEMLDKLVKGANQ